MTFKLYPLEEIADVIRGVSYNKSEAQSAIQDGYTPILRAGNIDGELILNEDLVYVPGKIVKKHQLLRVDDIVMCTSSGSASVVGKTAILRRNWHGSFGAFCAALRVNKALCSASYLAHYLRSNHFMRWACKSGGANIKNIRTSELREFTIPLPAVGEQNRIAAILDKADAIRRKRQDAIGLADTFLRSVFMKMFGRQIDLHKRWATKKIKDTGKVQLGRQRSPEYQTGKYTTPYIRVANVFEDKLDFTSLLSMDFNERDYAKYELQWGDILLNEGQSTDLVGRPAMWRNEVPNCCYQNTLIRFQVDSTQLTPEYALHIFLSYFRSGDFAKNSSKTSSVAHLGASRFAEMLMPLPPLSKQKEFSTLVNQHMKVKNNLNHAAKSDDKLFSSLQQRAFRGDL